MPENWKTYKLTELGILARGKSKHRPRDAAHLYGGKYPFVQTGDVKASNHRLYNHTQTYSERGLEQSKLWPRNTMCITIAANIAETAILNYPACFPDSIIGFIPNEELCDIDFIEYLIQHFKKQIQSHSIGSVQDNINLATFQRVEFKVPPLPEQRAIASILSALDDKIELNLQMNKTLEDMAMTLYKHWFVDFGPFQNGEFIDSELGKIPKGWEVSNLKDLVKIINGYAFKGKDFIDSGIPVLKIKNVKAGKILLNNLAYVSHEVASKAIRSKINFKDILITMTGNRFAGSPDTWVGKVAMFSRKGEYYLNQRVSKFNILGSRYISKHYLTLMLSSEEFQYYFINNSTSSGGQANISPDLIYNTAIVLPPENIQIEFDNILRNHFGQIFTNEQENETLKEIRDTILPKLISGELQVKDVEQKVAEVL